MACIAANATNILVAGAKESSRDMPEETQGSRSAKQLPNPASIFQPESGLLHQFRTMEHKSFHGRPLAKVEAGKNSQCGVLYGGLHVR
jgi:hypothetical protein